MSFFCSQKSLPEKSRQNIIHIRLVASPTSRTPVRNLSPLPLKRIQPKRKKLFAVLPDLLSFVSDRFTIEFCKFVVYVSLGYAWAFMAYGRNLF